MSPCPVDTYLKNSFPGIELKEHHHNVLQYQLPSHACCLARVFDVLSNNYEELGIVDYSVSQTTLDQVRATRQPELEFSTFVAHIIYRCFCHFIAMVLLLQYVVLPVLEVTCYCNRITFSCNEVM